MVAPTNNEEKVQKSSCGGFFQGIVNQLNKLAQLFCQVDSLAQVFFKVKENVQNFFCSFFASKNPPAHAETVNEVAMGPLGMKEKSEEKPPVVEEKTAPIVQEEIAPKLGEDVPQVEVEETVIPPPPVLEEIVEEVPTPKPVIQETVVQPPEVEIIVPKAVEKRVPTPFERAREGLDPHFQIKINSPVLPVRITSMEMDKTPEMAKDAREQILALQGLVQKNLALFAMSFFPQLNGIPNKSFLVKLGESPFLIDAALTEKAQKNGIENKGDHLTIYIQKRVLTLYPLQK